MPIKPENRHRYPKDWVSISARIRVERARNRCEYCRAPEVVFNFRLDIEHILPQSRNGNDEDDNLALSGQSCNLYKSDHITAFDEITQSETLLFHPRLDRWEEHIQVNVETGMIDGLTAIGRATVIRLKINSNAQLRARLQWIRFGMFP